MGTAYPGFIFNRSNLEMVKNFIFIICILLCFSSCGIFFQTPFPEELVYWENSVPIEGIGYFDHAHLYCIDSYVFLFIQQQNATNRLYIFTEDLEQLSMQDIEYHCDTFALKDALPSYYIGTGRYEIDIDGNVTLSSSQNPLENATSLPEDQRPPYGFGFAYNSNNYYIWWEYGNNALHYYQFDSTWGYLTEYSIELPVYNDIRALYYDPDPLDPYESKVIIFFNENDSRDIDVAMIPAYYFETDLNLLYYPPAYMAADTVTLRDIDAKYYYYTGDGFVIREHSGTSVRYDLQGSFQATLPSSNNEDSAEAYSQDEKTRYILSEQYMRLMKATVWW
jgi:hypothetical protein